MSREWQSTGQHVEVPGHVDRVPEFDPRSGDHLWTMVVMYRWGGPDVERPTLDNENLLLLTGPGCYYCEEKWSPLLAKRRCKGTAE